MADTTPTTPIKFGPVTTKPQTYRSNVLHGIETASSTYKRGAFVRYTSGKIAECAAPLLSSAPTTSIALGIAQSAATGTTDKEVMVDDAKFVYFEMTLSKTAGTHTLAQTDVGTLVTVSRDSASKNWYLEETAATEANGGALVVMLKDPIGTVDGRVICRVTGTAIQGS